MKSSPVPGVAVTEVVDFEHKSFQEERVFNFTAFAAFRAAKNMKPSGFASCAADALHGARHEIRTASVPAFEIRGNRVYINMIILYQPSSQDVRRVCPHPKER